MKRCALVVCLVLAAAAFAAAAPADFHFALIGDRAGGHVDAVYDGILAEVAGLAPDFAVTVGDQIEGYTEEPEALGEMWDEYLGIAAKLPVPLYLCPGNHDITTDGMLPAWRERAGREPCYSFDHEGVHVVVLDTSRWETSEDWLATSGYKDWLEKDLAAHAKARLTVAVYHKPYWWDTLAEGQADPMHELFKKYGVDAVFNGHFHDYASASYDGIAYTIVGSSGGDVGEEDPATGAFFQYVWCTVKDGKLSWVVLKKGSVLPPDNNTVADLKFAGRVASEYVWPEPFQLGDDAGATPTKCIVGLINGTDAPITLPLGWEAPANWTVTPASTTVTLEPRARGDAAFEVKSNGTLYPVPLLKGVYPYRPGKEFKFEGILPACRTQKVTPFAAAPAVDGALDDECWKGAAAATYFCARDGSACQADPTTFYFGYDADNLYVAARCAQEDMSKLVTNASEADGNVFNDDCVGLFLLPAAAGSEYYQVYANAAAVVMDIRDVAETPGNVRQDRTWNAGAVAAARRGEKEWTVEMAIPLAALGAEAPPARGTSWRVNFRRKEIYKDAYADWQFPIGFDPRLFGWLVFE